jgi:hypothetical protein
MTDLSTLLGGGVSGLDLGQLFNSVAESLAGKREHLNQMDGYNGDHGDNMVSIFEAASKTFAKHKDKPPADALEMVARQVGKLKSGSAQVYADGFTNAATRFKGQESLNLNDILQLVTTLLGLSDVGQEAAQPTQAADPLGSLLGSLAGGLTGAAQDSGGDSLVEDLLGGGLSLLQGGGESGGSLVEGLQGLLSNTPLGEVAHRKESASTVVSGLLDALPGLLGG